MPDYKSLSDEEVSSIAQEYYDRASDAVEQETPILILIGGQPGAGKTAAARSTRETLDNNGGFVHIDADMHHADILELKNGEFTASDTHEDCKKIAMMVRDLSIQGKRNILEEGLFRHPNDLTNKVITVRAVGFKCEIIGVATSREMSRLSVIERRESFREQYGYVRDVTEEKQDQGFKGFTENIIKNTAIFDRVRIISREGVLLYDSTGTGKYSSVTKALAEGRKLTDKQVVDLSQRYDDLLKECMAKGIPPAELARVHQARGLFDVYKTGEKHQYAQQNIKPNGDVLASDPRFYKHTATELAKAAYYRGVAEKDQIFRGKTPDFTTIDARLADRATLDKLPDVAEMAALKIGRNRKQGYGLEL